MACPMWQTSSHMKKRRGKVKQILQADLQQDFFLLADNDLCHSSVDIDARFCSFNEQLTWHANMATDEQNFLTVNYCRDPLK